MNKYHLIFIISLTTISLAIRLYRFTEPQKYYFDEVYHAVTAKAYADNNPAPYNPFSPPPKEGTAYDWLHPPLAKLIQAGSIKIFGDRPVGWRLPSVIFGTAIIPATFVLTNILFGPTAAIFASVAIAFENLTFVMSRITMNDVFVTFFIVISAIFTYKYTKHWQLLYLLLTSVFLGLALSSKWTGIYAIASVFLYLVTNQINKRKIDFKIAFIIIIPFFIYLASYGQFWLQGHTITEFINLHKQIWWYQNRGDLKHGYGTTALYCAPDGLDGPKTFCPWILNTRGVYLSYEAYGNKAGYIYALGNPLVFWSGIIAISYLVGKFVENRKKEYAIILLGYFIFWLPWVFAPRILFLHHYLPSIPFMSAAIGYSLFSLCKTRLHLLPLVISVIFVAVFFYFYPISSGYPIIIEDIDKYMWLPSWR